GSREHPRGLRRPQAAGSGARAGPRRRRGRAAGLAGQPAAGHGDARAPLRDAGPRLPALRPGAALLRIARLPLRHRQVRALRGGGGRRHPAPVPASRASPHRQRPGVAGGGDRRWSALMKLAPSILAADLADLAGAVAAVSPARPVGAMVDGLPRLDYVRLMWGNPGFSGQAFLPRSLDKARRLRRLIRDGGDLPDEIAMDGGIDRGNMEEVVAAGVE